MGLSLVISHWDLVLGAFLGQFVIIDYFMNFMLITYIMNHDDRD